MCLKSGIFCLCVLILIVTVFCSQEDDVTKSDELRQERTFDLDHFGGAANQEKWHAVDLLPSGSSDWIPAEGPEKSSTSEKDEIQEPVIKRRRPIRKRKRRPQNKDRYEDSSSDDIIIGRSPPRWPKRPQRLDQRDENNQWRDEMMAEEPYRPYRNYNRRRLYPKYDDELREEDGHKENSKYDDGHHRQEFEESVTDKIEERPNRRTYPKRKYTKPEVVTPSSSPVDLKAILKQSGGISLSELLQQRNLSLADLLKGEQHAISALTSVPEETSEPYDKYMQNDESDRKYSNYNRRLPPIRKYQNPDREEITTGGENLVPEQPNEDITTERRIFVPSHPKYYTSVDYKPNMNELSSIQTQTTSLSSTSTSTSTEQPEQTSESVSIISSTVTFSTSENPTIIKTKLKNRPRGTLPPTLAKLKKTTMKITTETENYPKILPVPAKAIKINLNELFGMPKLVQNIEEKPTTDGPMKISVNIGQIIEKSKNAITSDDKEDLEESTEKTEKVKELTAKDEIMEILSDSVSRQNLTKLLELRNMTLDELVEQRERGSSQRHLADIFHNQTKEPEPTDEMVIDVVKTNENSFLQPPSLFETFPAFDLRPDNNIQTTHYTRESRENQFNSKETSNDILGNVMVPIWRQAYTNPNENANAHTTDQKQKTYLLADKYLEDDLIINDETRRIEDIENKLVEAVNGALNIDVINHKTYDDVQEEENEFFRLPYGVRSAIIASAVIVGISILIFLTIFIVFKWTQRQKRQLNYTNSFSSKIKTPILETPYQRRIFTSIMNSTFGRKKKMPTISCSEPHSLQEYLWETDRKPFQ